MILHQIVDQGNFVAAGIRAEGMTARRNTVAGGSIEVDIERLEVQKMEVVEGMTVGKLPQVVYTVLEKMIHIPHLVIRQNWLVEEGTAKHYMRQDSAPLDYYP